MINPRAEIDRWAASAHHWTGNAATIAAMTRPVTRALVGQIAPRAGELIVDVACGTGDPALSLARGLRGRGRLLALDPVDAMSHATHDACAGEPVVVVLRARAEQLPIATGCVDAVSCRFGAMFLQPPRDACRELFRVLRVGGRTVLAVWGAREHNPYFTTVHAALEEAGAPRMTADPDQPTVFEFAAPGALAALLAEAGFARCVEQALPFTMRVPECDPGGFLDRQALFSPVIAERLQGLPAELVDRARRSVAERLAPHADRGDLALPALATLVRAER